MCLCLDTCVFIHNFKILLRGNGKKIVYETHTRINQHTYHTYSTPKTHLKTAKESCNFAPTAKKVGGGCTRSSLWLHCWTFQTLLKAKSVASYRFVPICVALNLLAYFTHVHSRLCSYYKWSLKGDLWTDSWHFLATLAKQREITKVLVFNETQSRTPKAKHYQANMQEKRSPPQRHYHRVGKNRWTVCHFRFGWPYE